MADQIFPEPTVGALIFDPEGRLFLMRSHKWHGAYVIPGGHIELGEKAVDALRREIREETSLEIYDIEFLCTQDFVYDDAFFKRRHFVFLDYACRTDSTDVVLNSEGHDPVWVRLEDLDSLGVDSYTLHAVEVYKKKKKE